MTPSPAGFGTKKTTIYVDGDAVSSQDDSSFSYTYTIPDGKKTSSLNIKVVLEDDAGYTAEDSLSVQANVL